MSFPGAIRSPRYSDAAKSIARVKDAAPRREPCHKPDMDKIAKIQGCVLPTLLKLRKKCNKRSQAVDVDLKITLRPGDLYRLLLLATCDLLGPSPHLVLRNHCRRRLSALPPSIRTYRRATMSACDMATEDKKLVLSTSDRGCTSTSLYCRHVQHGHLTRLLSLRGANA